MLDGIIGRHECFTVFHHLQKDKQRCENDAKMAEMYLVSGHGFCGQRHGLAMNWVDQPRTSADERDVVWAPPFRDCVWAVAGFGRFSLTSCFFVNSHLDNSRA